MQGMCLGINIFEKFFMGVWYTFLVKDYYLNKGRKEDYKVVQEEGAGVSNTPVLLLPLISR